MSVSGFTNSYIRNLVASNNEPMTKQHFVYDADGDVVDIYRVQSSAADGDDCLRQRFEYVTVGVNKNLDKIDWISSNWSSAWDI